MQLVTLVSEFIDLILESSSLVVVMYEQAWARQGSRDWEYKRKKKKKNQNVYIILLSTPSRWDGLELYTILKLFY